MAKHAVDAAKPADAHHDVRPACYDDGALGEYGIGPQPLLGSAKRSIAAAAMAHFSRARET